MSLVNYDDRFDLPPIDYDQSKVPQNIKERADGVREAIFGTQNKEFIAQNSEIAGLIASEAKEIAQQNKTRQDELEVQTEQSVAQMEADKNTIVANATADSEVILARGGKATLGQRLDETTAQLAQTASVINVKSYVVGDGIADDTLGLQTAINHAVAHKKTLHSEPSLNLSISGVILNGNITLSGGFNLFARNDNQPYVLLLKGKITSKANVIIDGLNKALYGIRGESFGRSTFSQTRVRQCKIWGFQYDKVGNNNNVQHDFLSADANGTLLSLDITQTTATGNVNTSTGGYGTFTINNPIEPELLQPESAYFVIYNDQAYLVRTLTATSIDITNLTIGDGMTDNLQLVIGGGVNIPFYGDSGSGSFSSLDINSNKGMGFNMASLYGHTISNMVCQGNTIGFGTSGYTRSFALLKPYFEINMIDIVINNFMSGIITEPIQDISKIQTLSKRPVNDLFSANGITFATSNVGGMISPNKIPLNTSAFTIEPGGVYNAERTSGNWNVTLKSTKTFNTLRLRTIIMNLSNFNDTTPNNLKITIDSDSGETIEGTAEFNGVSIGKSLVMIYKVGNDWKVNVINKPSKTGVNSTPSAIGLIAVSGGNAYVSVGTTSPADWKKITVS